MTGVADVVITKDDVDKFFDEIHINALKESIRASVDQQDIIAMSECEYCSFGKDNESLISRQKYEYSGVAGEPDLGIEAWINNNQLVVETDTEYQVKKINFCPVCGRPLNGENEHD